MLSRLGNSFSEQFHRFLGKLMQRRRQLSNTEVCAISITPKEILMIASHYQDQKINISFCESCPYEGSKHLQPILTDMVRRRQLKMKACIWILQPETYQLVTMDTLPVQETELQDAVRWKIKDLVQFPSDDLFVQQFPLPKSGDTYNKMMVVVAQASYLIKMSDIIQESGLDLSVIDIPELGLRNITALFEDNHQPTALLFIHEPTVELLISCQKQLYFVRRITIESSFFSTRKQEPNVPSDKLKSIERIAVEIQRSFDYFQSQWRLNVPERFFMVSSTTWTAEEVQYLTQRLSLNIASLQLQDHFFYRPGLTETLQNKFVIPLGAILQAEK